jgi:hypothetical protein
MPWKRKKIGHKNLFNNTIVIYFIYVCKVIKLFTWDFVIRLYKNIRYEINKENGK